MGTVLVNERVLRLALLVLAAVLRLWMLPDVPPGLTHDEADHGLSAWQVVEGARPLYFTVGYGREPLYDYATAGVMSFIGPTFLAGRLTAVYFSLLLLAATYALVKRLFGGRVALLTLAGLTAGFWPLMVSRQALRTITLPLFLVLAVYFWLEGSQEATGRRRPFFWSGLLLGLSFYTYFPARVMWLIFPALLLWWGWRRSGPVAWRGTLITLLTAGLVSLPLWLFLWQNPGAEQRLGQLSDPLIAARAGNFGPLAANILEGIRLIPFRGDTAWRYNIPGRPLLSPFLALLFGIGLLLAIRGTWRGRGVVTQFQSPPFARGGVGAPLLLIWLLLGLAPVFVTGAELANTRAIGILPAVYVFPALALSWMWSKADNRSLFARSAVVLLFTFTGLTTVQTYFFDWGRAPEVRVQYESTTIAAVAYLNRFGRGPAAISTTTPGRFHSQPIGRLTLTNPAVSLSWFDGRHALYLPAEAQALLLSSGFAPLDPAFLNLLGNPPPRDIFPLAETDLDRPLTVYEVDGVRWQSRLGADFGTALPGEVVFSPLLEFGGIGIDRAVLPPGETLVLTTLWRPRGSQEGDLVLFSQLLGPDGRPLAQADRLDAPASSWRAGDTFLQRHELRLPADAPAGEYPLIVGVYRQADLVRLPLTIDGALGGDFFQAATIRVENEKNSND